MGVGFYIFHKFYRSTWTNKNIYQVVDVKQEIRDVFTIRFQRLKEKLKPFSHIPGQFHIIQFFRSKENDGEEHPFTIAADPTVKEFSASSIRQSGDFTNTINETKAGDKVRIQGPFGRFSYYFRNDPGRKLLFISGGIGVTPIMSMLREMHSNRKNIEVVHLNSNRQEIVFFDELEKIKASGHPKLKTVYFLSEPNQDFSGEKGMITKEKIQKYIDDINQYEVYLCGPPPMMDAVEKTLQDMGLSDKFIHTERFSF